MKKKTTMKKATAFVKKVAKPVPQEPSLFTIERGVEPPVRTYAQTELIKQNLDKLVPKLAIKNSFVILTRQKATVYKHLKDTFSELAFRSTPTDKTRKYTRVWRTK